MTDKELLEFAAKSAGIELKWMTQIGNGVKPNEDFISNWHPLTDDGDALRLAVKLKISVFVAELLDEVEVGYFDNNSLMWAYLREHINNDQYAATRRAIVRAAAEIGKTQ